MTDQLKPCPFCGVDEPDLWDDNGGDTSWYQCRSCEARIGGFATREMAFDAWNTRRKGAVERAIPEREDTHREKSRPRGRG